MTQCRSTGTYLRSRDGFTLIQMVVVLGIMGILALIGAVEMRPDSLHGATRRLFSDLQDARMRAIKSRNSASVIFEEGAHSYRIEVDMNNDGIVDPNDPNEYIPRDLHDDYRRITIYRASNLRFDPLGMETQCSFVSACTITLTRPDETHPESRSISVYRTGGIWVERP